MSTIILHDNVLRGATVTSEDTKSGFPFANALDGKTSTQAGFVAGTNRVIDIDLGADHYISHLGFANHNLGTVGGVVALYGSTDGGSTYTYLYEIVTFSDDSVKIHAIDPFIPSSMHKRYIRLIIYSASVDAYISDIFAGVPLELTEGLPFGFVPPEYSDQDTINNSVTGGGAIVGVNVTTNPKKCKIELVGYLADWFSSYWAGLMTTIKKYPIYFQWDTGKPVLYGVRSKTNEPKYTAANRLSASLELEGFIE